MNGKRVIIAKIKMSENAYTSWMASDMILCNDILIPEDNFKNYPGASPIERFAGAFTYILPEKFFAEELANIAAKGESKPFQLIYNNRTGYLEFVRLVDHEELADNICAILSAANCKNDGQTDMCIVVSEDMDDIFCEFEIGTRKLHTVSSANMTKIIPDDFKKLWYSASASCAKRVYANQAIDKDILAVFLSIIRKRLDAGIENIIKKATPENTQILTQDALYRTDGVNVLNALGAIVANADPYTFISLGSCYAKDKNNVFYGTEMISDAKPLSFFVLAWDYAKDKHRAYFLGKPICDVHSNFKTLRPAYGYATDNKIVYYCGKPMEGSDPASFHAVGEGRENGGIYFGSDNNKAYLDGVHIDYIDPATFEHLGKHFFRDKNHVYFGANIIQDCTPQRVSVLNSFYIADLKNAFFIHSNEIITLKDVLSPKLRANNLFANDTRNVYYKGEIIEGIDARTANINDIHNDGYIYDAKSVFFFNVKLPVSPINFKSLGFGYATDGQQIFFRDKRLMDADIETFEPTSYGSANDRLAKYVFEKQISLKNLTNLINIAGHYFKDDKNIYYKKEPLKGADIDTFEVLKAEFHNDTKFKDGLNILRMLESEDERSEMDEICNYAKDIRNVYYKDSVIKDADAGTFSLLKHTKKDASENAEEVEHVYGKDCTSIYYMDTKVAEAEAESFTPFIIVDTWRDKRQVFQDGNAIAYIDVDTFEHIEHSFYKDINSVYYNTHLIDGIFPGKVVVLSNRYLKDDLFFSYVEFSNGQLISNLFEADPNSLDIAEFNPAFAFDKAHVYFRGKCIENFDIMHAEYLGDNYILSKGKIFCGNIEIPDADADSFMVLGEGYSFDGTSNYYQHILLNKDMPIYMLGDGYATDGKTFWLYGEVVPEPEKNEFITKNFNNYFNL